MKKYLVFALFLLVSVSLFAANTYDEGNPIATFGESGWEISSHGTLTPTTVDTTHFGGQRKLLVYPTTVYTLVAAQSGSVVVANVDWEDLSVVLPQATSGTIGTYFTFTHGGFTENDGVGNAEGIGVRSNATKIRVTPDALDIIRYLGMDTGDALQGAAATGDTVTLISNGSGEWWVMEMTGTWTDGGGSLDWAAGAHTDI